MEISFFKSLFDLHRGDIKKLISIAPNEAEYWTATWAYLQYLRLPCPTCGNKTLLILTRTCTSTGCGAQGTEVVDGFRQSGSFVKGPVEDNLHELLRKLLRAVRELE